MLKYKRFIRKIGPGVVTGASDDDPSGVVTYTQTGAGFGHGLLWLALCTTPMMIAVQEMSARLGMVSKQGLAALIRQRISPRAAVTVSLLLFIANAFNIGADLSALAAVTNLVRPGPTVLYLVGFTILITVLEVAISYKRYVNILKWLTVALFAYVFSLFVITIPWGDVLRHTILPTLPGGSGVVIAIVAILGTTISPYLFFWQTSEEVEESDQPEPSTKPTMLRRLREMRIDVSTGMVFSNLVMFCIIVTAAGTLYVHGVRDVATAEQAASVLKPIAGNLAFFLFSLGIIGGGLLAIPVLAGSAGYALAEAFGWSEGLAKTFNQARRFYLVIIVAMIVGLLMNGLHISPIKLLIYSAVINGLLAPVILWFILRLANDTQVVGEYVSPRWVTVFGWITFSLMSGAALVLIIQMFFH